MRPEIAELVDLLARSVYQRWRAGELVPNAAAGQVSHPQQNQLTSGPPVVYDRHRPMPPTELLGCTSTPTPGTARTGRPNTRPTMSPLLLPLQLVLLMFAGWINGHQLDVIEYLQEPRT